MEKYTETFRDAANVYTLNSNHTQIQMHKFHSATSKCNQAKKILNYLKMLNALKKVIDSRPLTCCKLKRNTNESLKSSACFQFCADDKSARRPYLIRDYLSHKRPNSL